MLRTKVYTILLVILGLFAQTNLLHAEQEDTELKDTLSFGVVFDYVKPQYWHTQEQVDPSEAFHNKRSARQDETKQIDQYAQFAEQGNPIAQYTLGLLLFRAENVLGGFTQASNWILKAAKQGYTNAQFTLATLYLAGVGVTRDHIKGYIWLTIAAELGHRKAAEVRDIISENMTPEKITVAQNRAKVCLESQYQDC